MYLGRRITNALLTHFTLSTVRNVVFANSEVEDAALSAADSFEEVSAVSSPSLSLSLSLSSDSSEDAIAGLCRLLPVLYLKNPSAACRARLVGFFEEMDWGEPDWESPERVRRKLLAASLQTSRVEKRLKEELIPRFRFHLEELPETDDGVLEDLVSDEQLRPYVRVFGDRKFVNHELYTTTFMRPDVDVVETMYKSIILAKFSASTVVGELDLDVVVGEVCAEDEVVEFKLNLKSHRAYLWREICVLRSFRILFDNLTAFEFFEVLRWVSERGQAVVPVDLSEIFGEEAPDDAVLAAARVPQEISPRDKALCAHLKLRRACEAVVAAAEAALPVTAFVQRGEVADAVARHPGRRQFELGYLRSSGRLPFDVEYRVPESELYRELISGVDSEITRSNLVEYVRIFSAINRIGQRPYPFFRRLARTHTVEQKAAELVIAGFAYPAVHNLALRLQNMCRPSGRDYQEVMESSDVAFFLAVNNLGFLEDAHFQKLAEILLAGRANEFIQRSNPRTFLDERTQAVEADEHRKCGKCRHEVSEAVVSLPCGKKTSHEFCRDCAEGLCKTGSSVICPTCHKVVFRGVWALKTLYLRNIRARGSVFVAFCELCGLWIV